MQKQQEVRPASVLATRERVLLAHMDQVLELAERAMIAKARAQNHDCGSDLCEDCTFDRMFS